MEQVTINAAEEADIFGAASVAIDEWQKSLDASETAQAEIIRLREESQMLSREEATLLADSSSDDRTTSKKLVEVRGRRELKALRLQQAENAFGPGRDILSGAEFDSLQTQAARLEGEIRSTTEQERDVFAGKLRGLEAGIHLAAIRRERDLKVAARERIQARLSSHKGATEFLVKSAAEEVQGQLESLVKQLIKKREGEANHLVDILCVDHKGCGLGLTSHFRSIKEAWRLRVAPFDPTEARQLLEQIRAMWAVEPLAGLLKACEQSD
jgi:hypothetical protein